MVSVVADVVATSNPTDALCFCIGVGIQERLHPIVIQRVGLDQVNDIKLVSVCFSCVLNREIKPATKKPKDSVYQQVILVKYRYHCV